MNGKVFEKALKASMRQVVKGSGWKNKQVSIFKETSGYFLSIYYFIGLFGKVDIRASIKPMNIDPIFWEIFGIPNNADQPLSFRAWGAFTCPSLIYFEDQFEFNLDTPEEAASFVVELANEKSTEALNWLSPIKFSDAIKQNESHQRYGRYGVSLIVSLISEGQLYEARDLAMAYDRGDLRCSFQMSQFNGPTFNQQVIEWINKRL